MCVKERNRPKGWFCDKLLLNMLSKKQFLVSSSIVIVVGGVLVGLFAFQQKSSFERKTQCAGYRKEVERRIASSQYSMMEILGIVYSKKLNTCVAIKGYSSPLRVLALEDALTGEVVSGSTIGMESVWSSDLETIKKVLDSE